MANEAEIKDLIQKCSEAPKAEIYFAYRDAILAAFSNQTDKLAAQSKDLADMTIACDHLEDEVTFADVRARILGEKNVALSKDLAAAEAEIERLREALKGIRYPSDSHSHNREDMLFGCCKVTIDKALAPHPRTQALEEYAAGRIREVLEKVMPECPGMLPCHCDEATMSKINSILAGLKRGE